MSPSELTCVPTMDQIFSRASSPTFKKNKNQSSSSHSLISTVTFTPFNKETVWLINSPPQTLNSAPHKPTTTTGSYARMVAYHKRRTMAVPTNNTQKSKNNPSPNFSTFQSWTHSTQTHNKPNPKPHLTKRSKTRQKTFPKTTVKPSYATYKNTDTK